MMGIDRLLVALLATTAAAQQCVCVKWSTPCEGLDTAPVAFVGTVTKGVGPEPPPYREHERFFAVVSIETVIRGLSEELRTTRVDLQAWTSCYVPMKAGERWLIFGSLEDSASNIVVPLSCTRPRRISREDAYIDRMVESYQVGPNLLFGDVRLADQNDSRWNTAKPANGAEITLFRGQNIWSARTEESGRFETRGVAPGEYGLSISKPGLGTEFLQGSAGLFGGKAPDQITIPSRGCVDVSVVLRPDTLVSGTVRSADGKPVPNVTVAAYQPGKTGRGRSIRSAITDEDGHYKIARLFPGRYILGINADIGRDDLYPTAFHPASSTERGAAAVVIAAGKYLTGVDIVIQPKRNVTAVRVRVLWPDLTPVDRAFVEIQHPVNGGLSFLGADDFINPFTNSEGLTSIRLREGQGYEITARWEKSITPLGKFHQVRMIWRSKTAKIIAAPELERTVILSEKIEQSPSPY